jgi:selenide,water dikinase
MPAATGEFARLLETRDDAAVVPIGDDLCLVQTVDFFTPIVDSPLWFGRLAAANALSDVYAMGARPLTAMNLVAWPSDLDFAILGEVLRGGMEKVLEAGAELAGGHSIDDKEPKFGLAVTGVARPDEIVYNGGAEAGDKLVLTKRLGIGVLASGLKNGVITEESMMDAIQDAAVLNAAAATAMARVGVHACTDVSGFGLAGHLGEMLDASKAAAELHLGAVPIHEGVLDLVAQQVYAGGLRNNREYLLQRLHEVGPAGAAELFPEGGRGAWAGEGAGGAAAGRFAGPITGQDPRVLTLFDPQTSGGLLMAVAPEKHGLLLDALGLAGAGAWTVGEVVAGPTGAIVLEG